MAGLYSGALSRPSPGVLRRFVHLYSAERERDDGAHSDHEPAEDIRGRAIHSTHDQCDQADAHGRDVDRANCAPHRQTETHEAMADVILTTAKRVAAVKESA